MLVVPDLMSAYQHGVLDDDGLKAVQLAMIAHCELMGDRVAILDAPPGLNAQQVKDWRMDVAGYDSKYAALYWPWIKVMDPRQRQAGRMPPSAATSPASGPATTRPAACTRRPPTRSSAAPSPRAQHHQGRARHAQPGRRQLHPGLPGPGHPGLGRAHAVQRPGVALPQRAPAVQLRREVDPATAPTGWSSSPTTRLLWGAVRRTSTCSCGGSGGAARCSARHPAEAFFVKCDEENNPPENRDAGHPHRRDRHRPGQARRVRRLPSLPVLRRRRARGVTGHSST